MKFKGSSEILKIRFKKTFSDRPTRFVGFLGNLSKSHEFLFAILKISSRNLFKIVSPEIQETPIILKRILTKLQSVVKFSKFFNRDLKISQQDFIQNRQFFWTLDRVKDSFNSTSQNFLLLKSQSPKKQHHRHRTDLRLSNFNADYRHPFAFSLPSPRQCVGHASVSTNLG